MGPAIFLAIALLYLALAARSRENAIAGAAILAPINQALPAPGIPMVNTQTLILLGVTWAILRRPAPENGAAGEAGRGVRVLSLYIAMGILAYVHSFFVVLPSHTRHFYDGMHNFLGFKEWFTTMFLGWAAFKVCGTPTQRRRVFWAAVIGFGMELLFCFVEFLVRASKVTGHLGEKNSMGAFLATYAAFALGVYVSWKGYPYRWVFLGGAVIGALCALGTRSRGGFLAVAATYALAALLKNRPLFLLIVALGLSYRLWMPEAVLQKFEEAIVVEEGSGGVELGDTASDRIQIWKAGLRALRDYPLGVGYGLYRMIVPTYGLEETLNHPYKNAHNEFVRVLVEFGIPAFAVFLALLATVGRSGWRLAHSARSPLERALGFGCFVALFASAAANCTVTLMARLDVSGILWILYGMMLRAASEPAPAKTGAAST